MAEKIKKNKDIILVLGIGLILAVIGVLGMSGMVVMPSPVSASSATDTVAVTATVSEWLSIDIATATLALGELVDSSGTSYVRDDSTTVDVGTNTANWKVQIHGVGDGTTGGLYSSTKTHLIETGTPTGVGTDKYGAQVSGVQANVTLAAAYELTGNNVGLISTSTAPATMATGTIRAVSEAFTMTVKASASTLTPAAADYGDTITLTLTPDT